MQGGFAATAAPPAIVHQDQKIGLSLAVLLIGFAGAFCFRHEPLLVPLPEPLEGAAELDRRIEHLSIRAYTAREGALPGEVPIQPASKPAATDGPLSDVFEIGQSPFRNSSFNPASSLDRIALFAGPPEPLRITADAAPSPPSKTSRLDGAAFPNGNSDDPLSTNHSVTPITTDDPSGPSLVSSSPPIARLGRPDEEPAFRTYEVRPGDTLSDLALRFLGSSHRYNELYEANRDVMTSPHALQAGMQLRIPVEPSANVKP